MTSNALISPFFLGTELTDPWITSLDPRLLKLFGSYLDKIEHNHKLYLGKIVTEQLNLEQLEQLEAHILSIFQRLGCSAPLPLCTLFSLDHHPSCSSMS